MAGGSYLTMGDEGNSIGINTKKHISMTRVFLSVKEMKAKLSAGRKAVFGSAPFGCALKRHGKEESTLVIINP
jgi:hypothetical protein